MTLPNTDLFIINRNRVNYQVDFDNLAKYIPSLPVGSRCIFFMQTAPNGWTTDNTAPFTESTVRIVSGSGGGSGGSKNFSYVFKNWSTSVPTHNHSVTSPSHKHTGSISHNHGITDPRHGHSAGGVGAAHNHPNNGPDGTAGSKNGPGPGTKLFQWSWRGNEQVPSYPSDGGGAGGTPNSAKSNVTVNNTAATITYSNAKAGSLSTTNTTTNVGTSLNFSVKYHKGIVCKKDVY